MTDLIGVRFVVLLSVEIRTISDIIENCDKWHATVSKDYLSEIDVNPKIFDYQSRHYEVRPITQFDYRGESITPEMCCEVQVRTLLQHAYAELVHDSIYKPSGDVPKSAERQIARSNSFQVITQKKLASNTLMKIYMLTSPSLIPLKSTLTTICQIKSTCYSVRKNTFRYG